MIGPSNPSEATDIRLVKDRALRVLILADDADSVDLVLDSLERPGLEITTCEGTEVAAWLIGRDRLDVLITTLDVTRPGLIDRLNLIRRATALPHPAKVLVVCDRVDKTLESLVTAFGAAALVDRSEGLESVRTFAISELSAGSAELAGEPCSITRFGALGELTTGSLSALLRPVVRLNEVTDSAVGYGVEGISRAPVDARPLSADHIMRPVGQQNDLVDLELRWFEAVVAEASHASWAGKVFVDLDPHAFSQPRFARQASGLARAQGRHESDFVFKIDGRRPLPDLRELASGLFAPRDLGFGVALDIHEGSFARGELLSALCPDYLEIGVHLPCGASGMNADRTLLRSVVESTQKLGPRVILGGIETEQDLQFAWESGAAFAQGEVFSPPLSGRELAVGLPPTKALRRPASRADQVGDPMPKNFESAEEHELSNTLTAIALFAAHAINSVEADDPLFDDLAQIQTASENAVALSEQIRASRSGDA